MRPDRPPRPGERYGAGGRLHSYHVVDGSGTDATAMLDGFTITAGNADEELGTNSLGGGMCNNQGDPSLTNCTFSGNSALSGRAVWGSAKLTHSILWGSGNEVDFATITFSNVEGGWTGEGNIFAILEFVDTGGPDDIPGTEDDDLRLQSTSPCIDAGDPDFVPHPGATDPLCDPLP